MFHKLSTLSLILFSTISLSAVDISGKITYERVHPLNTGTMSQLDFSNITEESAKEVLVQALDVSGTILTSTYTDSDGNYLLSGLAPNTNVKVRFWSKMDKSNGWNVSVIDNSNGNAPYVLDGSTTSTGTSDSIRNLKAPTTNSLSAPFAILDSVHQVMKKILTADSSVVFPTLKMNWSINNISTGTYYDGTDNIMIQGDQNGDSDEYDGHIIIHEFGHFFENKLSRADNIGGSHGTNEHLDIRVAFGEGFGNALSAIVTDDPVYVDTFNTSGWNMNIEQATHETPGWFSEASIQRILYDLYDSNDDGDDSLSLGFTPIYDILVGGQKTTKAFTSLFSFVTELKKANSIDSEEIDNIVASESITTINDSYGSTMVNNLSNITLPLYSNLTVNQTYKEVCTSNAYGVSNKLNNHKYLRFSISENKSYPIRVEQNNGSSSDPDYVLFKASPFEQVGLSEGSTLGLEQQSFTLSTGDYLLDISDANNKSEACFNVSVGEVTETTANSSNTSNSSNTTSSNTVGGTNSIGISLPQNPLLVLLVLLLLLSIGFLPALLIKKELK